jgi:hypothetical protein
MGRLKSFLRNVWILLLYLGTVLEHKFYIVVAGVWINKKMRGTGFRVSWKRLLLHDLSKLSSAELWPYAQHYKGEMAGKEKDPHFEKAWEHHYRNNDHHHEFWMAKKKTEPVLMPEEALMELVADWFAAQVAYDGHWPSNGRWKWVENKFSIISSQLHPVTAVFLSALLCILGFEKSVMMSLQGDAQLKFDWTEATSVVAKSRKELVNRFKVLHEHYQKHQKGEKSKDQ